MIIPKRRVLLLILTLIIFFTITTSYFVRVLSNAESEVKKTTELTIEEKILQKLPFVTDNYKIRRITSDNTTDTFIFNLKKITNVKKKEELWKEAKSWVSKARLYNFASTELGNLIYALKSAKIIEADVDTRGTQLKLLLTLEGGQKAVFKPKWYPIDRIIEGPVYAGKDRYGSEILAFYLSAILEKPLTPIATQRKISLKHDIIPVATNRLLNTIFNHNSSMCVYGKCYYCKKEDPVCEDTSNTLTGVIIFNVDADLKNHRSPWQRTYKKGKKAVWETNKDYCRTIKSKLSSHRLLDLIDTAVFDFIIQNGDRHHYETLDNNVVLIDNGKGLGNPHVHHLDILAPLYQCCMLRSTTWKRLELLSGGFLKEKLEAMPDIWNIVTQEHLTAIEQRLILIYATIEYCRARNKIENV